MGWGEALTSIVSIPSNMVTVQILYFEAYYLGGLATFRIVTILFSRIADFMAEFSFIQN